VAAAGARRNRRRGERMLRRQRAGRAKSKQAELEAALQRGPCQQSTPAGSEARLVAKQGLQRKVSAHRLNASK
jgi:hypothetical protein